MYSSRPHYAPGRCFEWVERQHLLLGKEILPNAISHTCLGQVNKQLLARVSSSVTPGSSASVYLLNVTPMTWHGRREGSPCRAGTCAFLLESFDLLGKNCNL